MDDGYSIRPVEADDSEIVRELWLRLHEEQSDLDPRGGLSDDAAERWENDFPVWLEDEDCCLLTAIDGDGNPVGFLHAERWYPPPTEPPSHDAYVHSVYVIPEHRNHGVGTHLVKAVADWARDRDIERLRFGVLHANEPGRDFWHELGGKEFVDIMTIDLGKTG